MIIAWIGCSYETWLLNIRSEEGFTLYTFLEFWNYQTSKFWSYSTHLGKTCSEKTCLSDEKIIWWQCPNQISESHISILHYHTWYCLFNNVSNCWSHRIRFETIFCLLLHSSFFISLNYQVSSPRLECWVLNCLLLLPRTKVEKTVLQRSFSSIPFCLVLICSIAHTSPK